MDVLPHCIVKIDNPWSEHSNELVIQSLNKISKILADCFKLLDYFYQNDILLDNKSICGDDVEEIGTSRKNIFLGLYDALKILQNHINKAVPTEEEHINIYCRKSQPQGTYAGARGDIFPSVHWYEQMALDSTNFPKETQESATNDPAFYVYWKFCALFHTWSELCHANKNTIPCRIQELRTQLNELLPLSQIQANRFKDFPGRP